MTRHIWQEEFHVYGITTENTEHDLDTDPSDCQACQKEINNRPQLPIKGWDYDVEGIALPDWFSDENEEDED